MSKKDDDHQISIDYILTDDPTDGNFIFLPQQLSPEKKLILAVLNNGIHQYLDNYRKMNRYQINQFKEAQTWIDSEDMSYIYTFESCCSVMGLDSDSIRNKLHKIINPYL